MNDLGIRITGLEKSYYGNKVIDIETLQLNMGKIYGLIGINGSGKTTLMKAITGEIPFEKGLVASQHLKFEMVHHEIGLFQELTVTENIFIHREPYRKLGPIRWIDWKTAKKDTIELLEKFGLDIDVNLKIKKVDLATQKILEIIIAISKDPDVLIIDEPLALLDHQQVVVVNGLLEQFMKDNNMIIYISHRMDELALLAHEVITLKNGHIESQQEVTENNRLSLWEFSEKDTNKYPKRKIKKGPELLKVEHLKTDRLKDISFTLNEGQIIGIVGLKGSRKSDIGRAIFGAIPWDGKIFVSGKEVKIKTTAQAVEQGLCFIGNAHESTFLEDSIYENVVSANGRRARRLSHTSKKLITKYYLEMMNVPTSSIKNDMASMSAGNKQKILLAKWFFSRSKVFIFNKPTANIDIPSKVDIYNIFSDLLESNAGIIILSNDLEEIAGICDQVLVVRDGLIKEVLKNEGLSVHKLVATLQDWG